MFIFIISFFNNIKAEDFYYFNLNTTSFPKIEVNNYHIDNSTIINTAASDLLISENNNLLEDFSLDCPKHDTNQSYSIIFAIDLSNSVNLKKKNLITSLVNSFLNVFDLSKCEVALIGFNKNNFLLHDFSTDKQSLLKYFDEISTYSYTNFDAAFINPTFSALNLSKNAKYKCKIILINDGAAPISKDSIINESKRQDVKISNVTLMTQTSRTINEITKQTNGLDLDNISSIESAEMSGKILAYYSQGFNPCKIIYNSQTCIEDNNISIKYKPTSQFKFLNYKAEKNKLPYLEIYPSPNIDFGFVNPTGSSLSKLNIIPRNKNILIKSIVDSQIFKLTGVSSNMLLLKDKEYEITVTFKPVDSNYTYFEIKLITDICDASTIRVSGGKETFIEQPHNLKIISPNGGEVFISGQSYILKWEGILATDTVAIDYSTNSGQSWQLITEKATGLEFEWNTIPKINSDMCLLRIKQLSKNSMGNKILKLTGIDGEVVGIKWKKDNSQILTGSTDGFLRYWNASNGGPSKTIYGAGIHDMKFIKFFDISFDEKTIAYTSKIEQYIIFIDIDSGFELDTINLKNKNCTSMNWNPKGNIFVAGTDDGTIYYWEFPNLLTPAKIISTGSPVKSIVWSNNGEMLAVGLLDGSVKFYNLNGDSINTIKNSDVAITSISWYKSDKIIAVSSLLEYINIYDITNPLIHLPIFDPKKPVNIVSWDPSFWMLATASSDSSVKLWDSPSAPSLKYTFNFHNNNVKSMSWSSDGKYIASGTIEGEVFIWSPEDIFVNSILQQDTSDNIWKIVNPRIEVKDVHFKQKYINRNVDTTVTSFLTNITSYDIIIDSVQIYGDTKQMFSIDNSLFPLKIKGNESIDLKLGFYPESLGFKIDTILIFNGNNIIRKIISGIGISPAIKIDPQFIDFGVVLLGDSSELQSVTVENLTDQDIDITIPEISGRWSSNFVFVDFDINPLTPYEIRTFNLKYKPVKTGSISATAIFDFTDFIESEKLILNGRSIAPQISFNNQVEISPLLCDTAISTFIYNIKNIGNAILVIDSIKFSDNIDKGFRLDLNGMSDKIQIGEETNFIISFNSPKIGSEWTNIEIYTNTNADGTKLNEVLVSAKRESVELLPNEKVLNYFVDLNEMQQKSLIIYNKGTIPIRCDTLETLKQFQILSINPRITLPGYSSEIKINFIGSSNPGMISEQLKIKDTCNNIYNVDLNAYIDMKNARIDIPVLINFNDIVCEEKSEPYKIYISNNGISPLIIEKIDIEDRDFEDFSIFKNISNNIILPNAKDSIEVIFEPKINSTGQKTTNLYIYSNALNAIDGKNLIELRAFKGLSDFSFSIDTLLIDNAFEKIQYFSEFEIVNKGNMPINWSFPISFTYFEIDSIIPKITLVDSKSKAYVRFKGASPIGLYEDIFKTQTLCGIERNIVFRTNITRKTNAGLRAGKINAAPGDSIVLPIYLFSPSNNDLPDVTGYKTTVSFNSTLLVPTSTDKGKILNGVRYIDMEFTGSPKQEGIIGSLQLIASLGNCDSSIINLSNSYAINDNKIKIEEENGIFHLDSVCYKGGPRLIGGNDTLKLYQNEPNPVNEETKFKFSIIEKGQYSLELYDLNGRYAKLIFAGILNPGLFELNVNLKDFSIGNYIYVLQTPQTRLFKKLTIHR